MRVQHNIMALNAYRNYSSNTTALSKNLEKLSSGYKINRAGDDAAGLAISEKMRAQITGLQTAQSNAKSGVNLVQTAEGSLTEVHDMLNRMVKLADQSANGTYDNETDRTNLQKEVTQLQSEIDRIADSSNFNGIKLLDGSLGSGTTGVEMTATATGGSANQLGTASGTQFTVSGLEAGKTVTLNLAVAGSGSSISFDSAGNMTMNLDGSASATYTQSDIDNLIKNATLPDSAKNLSVSIDKTITVDTDATALTNLLGAGNVGTVAAAKNATVTGNVAVTNTDGASTNVTVTSTKAGVNTSTLTVTNTATAAEGATANVNGNVSLNLDATKTYTASDINQLLSNAGAEMTTSFKGSLTGANIMAGSTAPGAGQYQLAGGAGLASGGGLTLQIGDTSDSFNKLTVSIGDMHADALGIGSIDISTQDGASSAVDLIKTAINTVSSTRGDLGATQNRLEHTMNNLSVMTENTQDAESTIRDTDVAEEMMAYTKNNILVQSAQAMLAQANQVPQGVLQLLQ